jgi:hypothetical protein
MTVATPGEPLEKLRQAYRDCLSRNGGRCPDFTHADAFIRALESEVRDLEQRLADCRLRLGRTGTVYQVPRH